MGKQFLLKLSYQIHKVIVTMLVIDFNVVLFVILTTEHHDIAIILIKMLLIAKSINKAIFEL